MLTSQWSHLLILLLSPSSSLCIPSMTGNSTCPPKGQPAASATELLSFSESVWKKGGEGESPLSKPLDRLNVVEEQSSKAVGTLLEWSRASSQNRVQAFCTTPDLPLLFILLAPPSESLLITYTLNQLHSTHPRSLLPHLCRPSLSPSHHTGATVLLLLTLH